MAKTKNKWGFLAPTKAKAEEMEKKYGVHFTPLIDYVKVIFPDIDDWKEEKEVNANQHIVVDGGDDFDLSVILKPNVVSCSKHIIVNIGERLNGGKRHAPWSPLPNSITDYHVYAIEPYTQLTNATVKQVFGIDVSENLFDENTPTLTQPWVKHISGVDADTALAGKYAGDQKQYQVNFDAYHRLYDNIGLSKVIVEKLFGLYSYKIDFNTDDNISILIGPNGCGKTTILKIIRFMLSGIGDVKEIAQIPFKAITCVFVNGRKIKLKSGNNALKAFIDNKKVAVFYEDEQRYYEDPDFVSWDNEVAKEFQEGTFFETKFLEEFRNENNVKTEETLAKIIFENHLKEYGCCFDVEFMSAQRLFSKIDDTSVKQRENVHQYLDTIIKIKDDFKHFCEETERKYNLLKSAAERDLLDEYLYGSIYSNTPQKILDESAFEKQWKDFIDKRNEYEDVAFFKFAEDHETNNYVGEAYNKNTSADKKEFLCIYLKKFEKTLILLGKSYNKIRLFKRIINERFKISKKQLVYRYGEMYLTTINKDKAIEEIPLDVLSSGEKNDFIMFYNLIFNCRNCKVLIDEPEISLHIEWQERYIGDLLEICKMNNIQALVATHSPSIINNHTDLIAKWEIKNE